MALHPDAIVILVLEELSFEGTSGVPWTRLWEILAERVPAVNKELYRPILYSWLKDNSNIILIGENDETVSTAPATFAEAEKCRVKVSEEYQWIALTGAPKQNNTVGARAFDLLVAIAHSRTQGIDSLDLIKTTGQDNRSLTSRIKSISHLIKKISILRGGRTLSLFTFNKFFDPSGVDSSTLAAKTDKLTINITELREKIVNATKAAKNGIRQVNDLRRELEMDKSARLKVMFKSQAAYLRDRGFVAKVLVVSPVSPSNKFRSLKYIKDFVANDDDNADGKDDEDDEDDDYNEDLVDDQLKDLDEEEPSASLRNVVNLQVMDTEDNSSPAPLFNRFYPAQTQIYDIVHSHGTSGCSSTFISDGLFGPVYQRLFSRWIEQYTAGKFLPHIANHAIIRHYDFQGRVKFYRYLTRPNLLKFSGQPEDPKGSSLPELKPSTATIESMNKKHMTPFVSRANVVEGSDGVKQIIWFGSITDLAPEVRSLLKDVSDSRPASPKPSADPDQPKRKRGRPRKGEERPKKEVKKPKVKVVKPKLEKPPDDELPDAIEPVEFEKLVVADLQGHSFKAIERLSALLRILEDADGVREDNHELYTEVCDELGYMTDRKTFRKDVNSLIEQKKIYIEEFTIPGVPDADYELEDEEDINIVIRLLVTINASRETVESFKQMLSAKRRTKKNLVREIDEVGAVDIDFFDTELRDEFNEPKKYQEPRIRTKREPKPKTLMDINDAAEGKKPKPKVKATGKVKARVKANPDATADEIFASVPNRAGPKKTSVRGKKLAKEDEELEALKIVRKKKKLAKPVVENTEGMKPLPKTRRRMGRKRRISHLNSEETLALFKAVVICKTINENTIDWEELAKLFETASARDLKAKWPRIRTMMGANGISVARRTWKKILLKAVKDGKVEMKDIEELNLRVLLKLWQDYQLLGLVEVSGEKLYADVEDNMKEFNFVKSNHASIPQYDYNSMVQREQFLVSKAFTYVEKMEDQDVDIKGDGKFKTEPSKEDFIRRTIIAILASGTNLEIKKLSVLDQFTEKEVNDVFLDMTKKREIVVSAADNKVSLGDRLTSLLEDSTYDFSLAKVTQLQELLKDLCSQNKGLVLDPVFDNSFMVPILELIRCQALNLTRVDHYRKEVLTGYEARTLEREKLDCDIILEKAQGKEGEIEGRPERSVVVPSGSPCSRIWVDVQGNINKTIWRKVVRVVLSTVLSQPGVTSEVLRGDLGTLMTSPELDEVIQWLAETGAVRRGEENGLWLCPQWYIILGLY